MCDEWMPGIKLPLTREQFHQLPRNPAYKYEYLDGEAYLTPRPRHYHALLELRAPAQASLEAARTGTTIRPARRADLAELEQAFAGAFSRMQPFGSLEEGPRREAARQCLERTGSGGDGPWIERASFVAVGSEPPHPVGAVLVTLLPAGDPCDWDSYYWTEPPPPDCVERRLGRPHLTWIFVTPLNAGRGVGTALLAAAVRELLALGFTRLASTFLLGNDSSMLWHWRNGFQLLAYPGSRRLLQQQLRK
jgi:GNAT superfamily N-acetyltransferase